MMIHRAKLELLVHLGAQLPHLLFVVRVAGTVPIHAAKCTALLVSCLVVVGFLIAELPAQLVHQRAIELDQVLQGDPFAVDAVV
ncbi:hypothetical protein D3C76_1072830 [compost metagenome]